MEQLALKPAYKWAWIASLALTALNGLKPAVVDDTAYLLFARHLSQHPADPYGFEMFWNAAPEPAMGVLMPPVLPYWLGLGIAIFGEHLFLLKLWLFPFALILCRSTAWHVARFAPGQERTGLIVVALSPAVLVLFNFMLDVPALALGMAALRLFIGGCDRRRILPILASGLVAGLAMQTKYSLLVLPVVFVWYAMLHRRWVAAIIGVSVAAGAFWAWEYWLIQKYGHSHFWVNAKGDRDEALNLADALDTRLSLVQPLLGQFGGLMLGVSLWLASAFRPRVALGTALVCAGFLIPIFLVSLSEWHGALLTFQIFGALILCNFWCATWKMLRDAEWSDSVFLIGWVLLEAAGALGLSPFPAARRMLGVCFAMSLLGVRAVGVSGVSLRPATAGSVAFSLLFFAVDCWDAQPEKILAARAAEIARPVPGETIWFNGHWGFQYYCDLVGMQPVVPGQSTLQPGDWLIYPVIPDDGGFYRPWHGFASFTIDPDRVEKIMTLTWDDPLMAQTIPNLYGGSIPICNRNHSRLKLAIYRMLSPWSPRRE